LAGAQFTDVETVGIDPGGAETAISLTVAPLRAASGEVTGSLRLCRDAAGGRQSERAARRLAAIVESSDDALITKDLNGIVKSWNAGAQRIFGYTPAEMIGESIRRLIPADRQSEEDEVLARIRRGDKVDHYETIRCHKDGREVPISLTVSPVRDAQGRVI